MSVLWASWNQRHRLGQTLSDAAGDVRNAHHTVASLCADGFFDERAMRTAWHALQLRHPVLASGFDPHSGRWTIPERPEPTDLTITQPPARLSATAAGPGASVLADEAVPALLREAAARPFNLIDGPLARLLVVPLSGSRTLLQLTVEHLISDGWSLNVLMRDLAALYSAALKGEPPRLPPPADEAFPEFVRRQNIMLESGPGRAAVRALADLVSDTGPVPATPIAGFSGSRTIRYDRRDSIVRRLDAPLCQALTKRARAAGMSPPTLMHAALHDGLWRLSDAQRVATTLSTANRDAAGADSMVGWLSSKVVVTSEPGRATDLDDFLAAFHRRVLSAFDLARVPWPRLIAEMTPWALGRHTSEPYVTFNAQTVGMLRYLGPLQFENLTITTLPVSVGWHDASIATFWNEDSDGMRVTINWKTDWYQAPDMERLWTAIRDTLRRWAGTETG